MTPLIIFPFAISPRLSITIHRVYATRDDTLHRDVKRGKSAIRGPTQPGRAEEEQRTSSRFFSPLVIAVSKGSIDLSRVDLSPSPPPLPSLKKSRDAKNRRKKKDDGKKCSVGTGGARWSQRKMDFRKVRAGLNSRKMSKRVEE